MNKIAVLLVFLLAVFGSFYVGLKVGVAKRSALDFAWDASGAFSELVEIRPDVETLDHRDSVLEARNISVIHGSIQDYGYYLGHWTSKVPDLTGIDEITRSSFEETISYYLENHYQPLEQSPEDHIAELRGEMIKNGKWDPEFSEHNLNNLRQDLNDFGRAIEYVTK